jgi:hypothetical protein
MAVPTPDDSADSQTADAKPPLARPAKRPVALPPLEYAFQMLLLPVKKSLARIEARLEQNAIPTAAGNPGTDQALAPPQPVAAPEAGPSVDGGPLAALQHRLNQLSAELAEFRGEAMTLLQFNPAAAAPVAVPEVDTADPVSALLIPDPADADAASRQSWEDIVFGAELCADSSLDPIRRQFLDDVVSGSVPARALAGQLLLLQATEINELPERFRHVGEAFYRWRPRLTTDDEPLEQALADWLTRLADGAGLRNSIQLVRPGDRFDSTRHSAATRGVEVVAVHGWVVLRDNQKVYTKASVTVR